MNDQPADVTILERISKTLTLVEADGPQTGPCGGFFLPPAMKAVSPPQRPPQLADGSCAMS